MYHEAQMLIVEEESEYGSLSTSSLSPPLSINLSFHWVLEPLFFLPLPPPLVYPPLLLRFLTN